MNFTKSKALINFFVLLSVSLLFATCIKQDRRSPEIQNGDAIKEWLTNQKGNFVKSEAWIDSVTAGADFEHAHEITLQSEVKVLIVPLTLNVRQKMGETFMVEATQTKLLMFKNELGKYVGGKLIAISSNIHYDENYITGLIKSMLDFEFAYKTKFTGTVTLLYINKSLLYQSVYVKGNYTQRKLFQSSRTIAGGITLPANHKSVSPNSVGCTDWYLMTYNYLTFEVISVTYQYTTCDGGSGSGGGGGGAGLESVTEWVSYEGGPSNGYLCPDNDFFKVTAVGGSFTGQIEHLGLSAIGPYVDFFNAEFGSTCVSIPSYNGLTSGQASSLFIQAYNGAVLDVLQAINGNQLIPKSTPVKTYMKTRLLARLQNLRAGSSFSTGSPCGGTVPITNARYC